MAAATIRDVAKQAGVSVATVSRVLNNSPLVSEETNKKVQTAIDALDYSPSQIARRLSIGRTQTIGVIVPFLTLPSYVERLRGVESILATSEYDLVLFTADTPEKVNSYFRELSRPERTDGVIVISLKPDDYHSKRFQEANIPLVLVDAYHPSFTSIVVDDTEGGYSATCHLIELGHTKIAYLCDHLDNPFGFIAMQNRFNGYKKALSEVGINFRPDFHQQGELGGREAVALAKKLLTAPDPPTAIFAASDIHAVGVLKAAQELGIRIPDELSVIGFDGIRDSEYLDITTIHQPLFESGVLSVELLLASLIEDSIVDKRRILPTSLIVRGTTAPPHS
ncbi:MAG: LacI family DNA-binding transcriptional regulator [Anaerolineales bacterium]